MGRSDDVQTSITVVAANASSAVPVWTANANRPLNSLTASLVVGQDHWLKLKDFDGTVVWNVSDVAPMEVLDSGNLVMYNSSSVTVWQSFDHPQDVLDGNGNPETGGFNNLLGEGGFGAVYAGVLLDGRQVAVKKLGITKLHGKQFLAEVATIGQTSHFNIVPLIGFCFDISNRLLVYEYMENGSLDQWLFNAAENEHLLDWATRFNVAIGIARGLAYLHGDCPNPILHLDINPQNILLDKNFVPKLADFGLSRLISRDISQVVTMGRGTPGYIAPELCLSQAAVSKKSDVYSLGMVLLEIVGGRKKIDISLLLAGKAEEWHFPSWAAKNCAEGKIADLVDARLQGAFQTDEARRMILAAMWCIQEDPSLRPSAATVSKWLRGSGLPIEQPSYASVAYSRSQLHLSITRSVRQSDTIL